MCKSFNVVRYKVLNGELSGDPVVLFDSVPLKQAVILLPKCMEVPGTINRIIPALWAAK